MAKEVTIPKKKIRRFVSDASHELRTPVTVIRGYSDMLSRWGASDPETLEEGLSAIHSEAEDMQGLIEKLLFLARADQKRLAMHKERLGPAGAAAYGYGNPNEIPQWKADHIVASPQEFLTMLKRLPT